MPVGTQELYEETFESLERMQNFDVESLPREATLGSELHFRDVKEPAQQLINLYKRLSIMALVDFPDKILTQIRDNSNSHYQLFSQVLEFKTAQENPQVARTNIIDNIKNAYVSLFLVIHPFISYSLHRSADFQQLDSQARAALQTINDHAEASTKQLTTYENEASSILDEIRNVAAEQGVSLEATHFHNESDEHDTEAEIWRNRTKALAWSLFTFAIASFFVHKIPWIAPENMADTVQLSISKFLVLAVIGFMLLLSAKNFLGHKHNSIINKHRANALLTYRAIVEAAGDRGVRDAIVMQAASCIYSPQTTGYASDAGQDILTQKSSIELMSRQASQASSPTVS